MTRARALVVLLALFPIAAAASETNVLEQRARDFYVAWASGDAVAASRFWIDTKRESFFARASRTAATRCQQLHELRIAGLAVDGDTATVDINVRIVRWSAMPSSAIDEHHGRETLTFLNKRGDWKITDWRTREEQLAEQVIAAADPAALLREHAHLRNRRLVDAICKRVVTLSNRQEISRAEMILALAHAIANELDDPAARANTMSTESILRRTARLDLAGSTMAAEEAVAWAQRSRDPDVLARTLMRLGRAQYEVRNADAAATFDRALGLADFVEDASVLAHAASQRARIFDSKDELRNGLRFSRMAASFAAMSGDATATLSALLNLVGSYKERGDLQQALAHAHAALAIAEREGFINSQSSLLGEIASYELWLGMPEQFLRRTARALELLGDQGSADGRVDLHAKRAEYWLGLGDLVAAEAEIEGGEMAFAESPDGDSATHFIAVSLRLRIRQGRYDDARRIAERAPHDWRTLGLRAEILEAQGRLDEARCLLEEAVASIEDRRLEVDGLLHRGFSFPYLTYSQLVDNLVQADEVPQALVVAERMKARVLKDLMARNAPQPSDTPEVEQRTRRVVDLNRQLLRIRSDGGDASTVEAALRGARRELDEVLTLRNRQPPPVAQPDTFDLETLVVPAATTVIEYVVGLKRTTAFVLRAERGETRVEAHTIPLGTQSLSIVVDAFVKTIESRDAKYRAAARRLYDLLLAPLVGPQPAGAALCIIPDAHLGRLPFQALVTPGGEHVIERTAVFYAPSLALLSAPNVSRRPDRVPTVLAFGDPAIDSATRREYATHRGITIGRLPDASREVDQLRRIYGTRVTAHTAAAAAESTLKRDIDRYDVIHFATHGIVDSSSPMYSALLLAGSAQEDGLLEAREILGLPLQAELVVLSACNTARGTVLGGEGIVGLSWAFLGAGCPRTVATQWRVGSASAARLMIAFHRRMAREPRIANVARSLRAAQLEMLRDRRYAHPYYWAGFVLVGRDD